jgi:hypothetical protein
MDQNCSSWNGALEQRIGLMRELGHSLEQARAAILNSDLAELGAQTMRQSELCERWRLLVSKLSVDLSPPPTCAVPKSHGAADPSNHSERRRALLVELAEVEARVNNLNLAYGALLRRARRTVDIFCRVLANSGVTYAQPALRPLSNTQHSKG